MTSVGWGTRSPVTTWDGVSIRSGAAQRGLRASNSPFTQRLAAPMPRVGDVVSERVCRVPKPTRRVIVARRRAGSTRAGIWRSCTRCAASGVRAEAAPARNRAAIRLLVKTVRKENPLAD